MSLSAPGPSTPARAAAGGAARGTALGATARPAPVSPGLNLSRVRIPRRRPGPFGARPLRQCSRTPSPTMRVPRFASRPPCARSSGPSALWRRKRGCLSRGRTRRRWPPPPSRRPRRVAHWTVDTVAPFELPGLIRLALLAHQDDKADAAIARWLQLAPDSFARADRLVQSLRFETWSRPVTARRLHAAEADAAQLQAMANAASNGSLTAEECVWGQQLLSLVYRELGQDSLAYASMDESIAFGLEPPHAEPVP